MRVVCWVVCALMGLTACKETLRREISFTAVELQAKIVKQFPLARRGKLAKVVLWHPEVLLQAGSQRIGLHAEVEIAPVLGRAFRGTMAFDAGVDYNADKGEFYLVDSRIGALEFDEVLGQCRALVRELANQVLGRYLDQLAVYRLDPDDFEESLAKLVLKEVAVEGGRLVLRIGLL